MKKKESTIKNFGEKLSRIRRAKGFTQTELGKKIGVSQRVIAYYEGETSYPPTHLIIPIAKVLKVSLDDLLGLKKVDISDTNHIRFWNKFKKAENLTPKDKRALLNYLDALLYRSKPKVDN